MEKVFLREELKHFLDDRDRLIQYPAKYRLQVISLFYLAGKFEPGRKYTEREVNDIIKNWHCFEDWTMLRRDLCDGHFLGREKNGSAYWLEEKPPVLADFGLTG